MRNGASDTPAVVLLVERDRDIARKIEQRLAAMGVIVKSEPDEDHAITITRMERPSVIIYAPPARAEGRLNFITRVRDAEPTIAAPLLILAHDLTDAELYNALELGATDFVVRPFQVAELVARVQSAIRISKLLRLLEHRARIDPLTTLWNRLYFSERLNAAVATVNRIQGPLSLALIDIDHFKRVNDTFGHATGDAVLKQFAAVLRKSIRAGDTACRYGGEEFAVILNNAHADDAIRFCQRIRALLASSAWPEPMTNPVTASFGIATSNALADAHPQEWIEAADKALYAAKDAGRDRIHTYHTNGELRPAPRLAG